MVSLTNNSAVPPGGFCLTLTVNEPSAEVVAWHFPLKDRLLARHIPLAVKVIPGAVNLRYAP